MPRMELEAQRSGEEARQRSPKLPDRFHRRRRPNSPQAINTKIITLMNDPARGPEPSARRKAARRTTAVLGRLCVNRLQCTLFYNPSVLWTLCSCVTKPLSATTGVPMCKLESIKAKERNRYLTFVSV
uniref:Uncharacterized protein n=1 Tax=Gasterosteus aculeatus TaxID=69293 RepID=G3PAC2_GASAC